MAPGTCPPGVPRLSLPSGLTSSSTTKIPALKIAGGASRDLAGTAQHFWLIEPSVTYLTGAIKDSTNNPLFKRAGNNFTGSGDTMSFVNVIVPISGWNN